ncbi:DUF192 domain-containing protein [Methylomonas sp. SURF-2]|uniref:DUF192 domain-containing protein n=1 Tax=Methylomonas subterranea TaxID=2952225 RepID=A0ABT1TGA7_9GAMM|nr:DUF192 domain-containing protein [Methylomonas sp. SURF-2]MCQ8104349.1 DUF192 domain-containing protein [Methylomonas sp. SURF-2]
MHIRFKLFNWVFPLLLPHATAFSDPAQAVVSFSKNHQLDVEIADTPALRELGLMHREHLADNRGMLFVYPDQELRGVWMKNTLLALDVLFLSADHKVVSMLPHLTPCRHDPCPNYLSSAPAKYMLEVNAGFIEKNQIEIGREVMLDYRHDVP